MSGRTIKAGLTDQYCEVKVWTTADGVPNTTLVYNTAALAIWYQIGNAAPVEVVVGGSPAPATMAAGGSHADWGIYHVAQGRYKIGLADAVVSAAANVTVWIEFTDCDSAPCEIDVVGYDKTAAAVGANTVAPATPANVTTSTSTITALLPANFNTLVITAGDIAGTVGGIAGTINTLDALDTAQDTQHGTTQDRLGYTLAALAGACADAGTAAETYAITIGADTYTIDHTGLDATGNRSTATLTKS